MPHSSAHTWVNAARASVTGLVPRLISALGDWREREQLRTELDKLDLTGRLDCVLEDVGLRRDQIPALVAGRPGAAERMDRMLLRRGLDRAALRAAGELRDAAWRCSRCQATHQCERWLAADPADATDPFFCPNDATFDRIQDREPKP